MSRINTNVPALIAQTELSRSNRDLNTSLERLSSGLRINRGADDPAGLIASESLRSEIQALGQAIDNSQRATNVIATAEGAFNEVAALLVNVQELVIEAANSGALSQEEIEANQLQVDSAVESITRIANTTTFAGLQLLNGQLDYITSGVNSSEVEALKVFGAQFGSNSTIPVELEVVASAQHAALEFRTSQLASTVTLEIAGSDGVEVLTFVSGTAASAIAAAVNTIVDNTGVSAALLNVGNPASGISFSSIGYGSSQFVSVEALGSSGTFVTVDGGGGSATRDLGRDTTATINGVLTVGDGLNLNLNTTALDLSLTLDASFGVGNSSFVITGGGALFQLGADVKGSQQTSIGIQSVAASRLGNGTVGFLSDIVTGGPSSLVGGRAGQASKIIDAAISDVAVQRGRLGSFERNTLQTNISSLQITLENVTSAESAIRDTDFASETSRLTRAQILTQAGTSVLAIANSMPQTVLALLQ